MRRRGGRESAIVRATFGSWRTRRIKRQLGQDRTHHPAFKRLIGVDGTMAAKPAYAEAYQR